jgi:hypothetical protein
MRQQLVDRVHAPRVDRAKGAQRRAFNPSNRKPQELSIRLSSWLIEMPGVNLTGVLRLSRTHAYLQSSRIRR